MFLLAFMLIITAGCNLKTTKEKSVATIPNVPAQPVSEVKEALNPLIKEYFDECRCYECVNDQDKMDATFKIDGHCWAHDKNRVYFYGSTVKMADPVTFKILGDDGWARDKNNIYFWGKNVEGTSVNDFTIDDDGWAHDKSNNYLNGKLVNKYSYQDKELTFANIKNHKNTGLGTTDTYAYILDKKTNIKTTLFTFAKSGPGSINLPAINKTNQANIIIVSSSDGDASGGGSNTKGIDMSNNKLLEVSLTTSEEPDILIINKTKLTLKIQDNGCNRNFYGAESTCKNLKPTLQDLLINNVAQKIITNQEAIPCTFASACGIAAGFEIKGINSDLSKVYFILQKYQNNETTKLEDFTFDVNSLQVTTGIPDDLVIQTTKNDSVAY